MRRHPGFWIALVLFLGLAAWIRWFEPARRADQAAAKQDSFLSVEPTRVAAITAAWMDTTRIEKQNGEWYIVSPVRFPADAYAVEAILSRCRDLSLRRSFKLEPGNEARYGLDSPRAWIRFDLSDSTNVKLLIGAPAPASPAFYVQVAGRPEVGLLTETDVDNFFRKEVNGWRRRNLFIFPSGQARSIDLEAGGRQVSLAYDRAADSWRVLTPFPGPADNQVMKDYLKGILAMKARSYPVDHPASLAPYGLTRPAARIIATLADGRRDSILLGDVYTSPTDEERYARVSGLENIFGVPTAYLDVAGRSDFFFRAKRPFPVTPASVASILIRMDADSLLLEPDSTHAWRLRGEKGLPGSPPPDRSELVRLWATARADSIVPAAAVRFPPPAKRLVVEVRTGFGRSTLEIGDALAIRGREMWPSRLIFSDPPRPGEVFLLNSELVRQTLALFQLH